MAYRGKIVEFVPESNGWHELEIYVYAEDEVVYDQVRRAALICFRHEEGYWTVFRDDLLCDRVFVTSTLVFKSKISKLKV